MIPGIETAAPERTETMSGRRGDPNPRPVAFSSSAIPSASRPLAQSGSCRSPSKYSSQTSTGRAKPGGTGIPISAISARTEALFP